MTLKELTASESLEQKTIAGLAYIVRTDWKKVNFAAVPYLEAMETMESIDDMYLAEPGTMIVAYFLGNATSWRGETARKVKAELKSRL